MGLVDDHEVAHGPLLIVAAAFDQSVMGCDLNGPVMQSFNFALPDVIVSDVAIGAAERFSIGIRRSSSSA
jgi:hypothetical protein